MVDTLNHPWLAALSNSMTVTTAAGGTDENEKAKLLQPGPIKWAGSRETNLDSGRGGAFFLTSLFIELIDPGGGVFVKSLANDSHFLTCGAHGSSGPRLKGVDL